MASPSFYDAQGAPNPHGSVAFGSGAQEVYRGRYPSTNPTYDVQQNQESQLRGSAYTQQQQPATPYIAQQSPQTQAQQYDYASAQPQQTKVPRPTLVHSAQSPAWVLQPAMWVHVPPNWVFQRAIWVPPVVIGTNESSAASHTANTPVSDNLNARTPSVMAVDPQPSATPQPQPQAQIQDKEPLPGLSLPALEVGPSLDKIPDDVLFQLDSPENFSCTSKRFKSISENVYFRAQWLLHRYQMHEVLFEAIARPKIFTVDLFNKLLRGGAILSRNLAQLLKVLHTPNLISGLISTSWGSSITFDSWWAVLEEAKRLYGSIPLEHRTDLDSMVFNAIMYSNFGNLEDLSRLFVTNRFMPLPLRFENETKQDRDTRRIIVARNQFSNVIKQVLIRYPSLATAIRANGYKVPFEDAVWMARKVFGKARTQGDSRQEILATLQHFKKLGLLKITREVASEVVYSLRDPGGLPQNEEGGAAFLEAYGALVELDRRGELEGFQLKNVIQDIISYWKGGAVDNSMVYFTDHVEPDFNTLDIGWLVARTTFLKTTHNIDFIKTLIGRHQVTYDDILQASLYNLSISTLPLQFAVKYVEGFDLASFVEQLLECLLAQPYRGLMLRRLYGLLCLGANTAQGGTSLKGAVDFLQMLSDAVETQAFMHSQLPLQQWNLVSGNSNGIRPVVRSMLAFHLQGSNATHINVARPKGEVTTGPFLDSFTRFRRQVTDSGDGSTSSVQQTETQSELGDGLLMRFRGLDDALWVREQESSFDHRERRREAIESRRYSNIHGPIPARGMKEDVPDAIVDILGSASKSADVLMSHALLNGNTELATRLLAKGVPLTLEHIKICMRTGYGVPSVLLHHIQNGAPFKSSFDARVDEPNKKLLSLKSNRAKAVLSLQEASMCKAISKVGTDDTAVYIEIDDDGVLHVHSEPSYCTGVTKEIITEEPVETTPAEESSAANSTTSMSANAGETSASADPRQPLGTLSAGLLNAPSDAMAPGSSEPIKENSGYVINMGTGSNVVSKIELNCRLRSLELWQSHLTVLRQFEDRKHVALKACQWQKVSLKRNASQKDLGDAFLKTGLPQAVQALNDAPTVTAAAAGAVAAAEMAAQQAAISAALENGKDEEPSAAVKRLATAAHENAGDSGEPAAKRLKINPGV